MTTIYNEDFVSTVESLVDAIVLDDLEARALQAGFQLDPVEGGFLLFALDGEQLGWNDEPWSAEDVLGYCEQYQEFQRTGVFVTC